MTDTAGSPASQVDDLATSPSYRQHVLQARWFAGKGRSATIEAVTPLDWFVRSPDLSVRSELCTVSYPDGAMEHYQTLISYRPQAREQGVVATTALGVAHDATTDPEALSALIEAVADHGDREGSWSAVVMHPELLTGAVEVFAGEQSNTNLLVGEHALFKVFRKLENGRNLDIAVHDALARSGSTSVARLLGWVEGQLPSGEHTDLAMVVERLAQATDGWGLAVAAASSGTDFTDQAAALGQGLAEVHRSLADTFPATTYAGHQVAATMVERLHRACEAAPVLADHIEGLQAIFEQLRPMTLNAQQTHGDFHLGQTLHTPKGWRIIDFEGEPMKTLTERRLPDSKWRDVAGLLRSFDYATSAAEDPASAAQWYGATSEAFLQAYSPTITDEQRRVLHAYLADRAIYELVYETRNRPTWVNIPLRAIAALMNRS